VKERTKNLLDGKLNGFPGLAKYICFLCFLRGVLIEAGNWYIRTTIQGNLPKE